MSRSFVILVGLALAAPAAAATYSGKPVAPASEVKLVARDIVWNQAGGSYHGRSDESRPLVLCQSLAKRAGRLERFTVDGRPFGEAELARCNASAPAGPSAALAEAN